MGSYKKLHQGVAFEISLKSEYLVVYCYITSPHKTLWLKTISYPSLFCGLPGPWDVGPEAALLAGCLFGSLTFPL